MRQLATIVRKLKSFRQYMNAPSLPVRLMAFQALCAFAILYGVSYWSVPIAIVIGGVGGIVAAERQQTEPERDASFAEQARQVRADLLGARGLGNEVVKIDAVVSALNEG